MTPDISSRRRRYSHMHALASAAALAVLAAVSISSAQVTDAPDMVTRKVRLRGSEDSNVKAAPEVNVRNKASDVVPPAGKSPAGKPQCAVRFDNHTDLIAKTYIDGRFAGTIRPFGAL